MEKKIEIPKEAIFISHAEIRTCTSAQHFVLKVWLAAEKHRKSNFFRPALLESKLLSSFEHTVGQQELSIQHKPLATIAHIMPCMPFARHDHVLGVKVVIGLTPSPYHTMSEFSSGYDFYGPSEARIIGRMWCPFHPSHIYGGSSWMPVVLMQKGS